MSLNLVVAGGGGLCLNLGDARRLIKFSSRGGGYVLVWVMLGG